MSARLRNPWPAGATSAPALISAAQVAAPSATLLANKHRLLQLNQAPWTLYRSNGNTLVDLGSGRGARVALEAPIAAETVTTDPVCDFITALVSDANGGANQEEWAGNSKEKGPLRMGDGVTYFAWYNQAGGKLALIRYQVVAGAIANQSQVFQVTTDLCHASLLRDKVNDIAHWITYEGFTLNYTITIRTFSSAGVLLNTATVDSSFTQSLGNGGAYVSAGISDDGRTVCIKGFTERMPASERLTTTRHTESQWLVGDFDLPSLTWSWDPVARIFVGDRRAYDQVFVGVTGNPDEIVAINTRDVRWDEDFDYVTAKAGPTAGSGTYLFNAIGWEIFNRRTGDHRWRWLTHLQSWKADTASATLIGSDTPQQRVKQAIVDADGNLHFTYLCNRPINYPATTGNTDYKQTHRYMKVRPADGRILIHEEVRCGTGSSSSSGDLALTQLASGRIYAVHINDGANQTELAVLEVNFNVKATYNGSISGTTLTASGVVGKLDVGSKIFFPGVVTNTYVVARGTGVGGDGTYILNNAQTVALQAMTARAPVMLEPIANDNHLCSNDWPVAGSKGWGTLTSYRGGNASNAVVTASIAGKVMTVTAGGGTSGSYVYPGQIISGTGVAGGKIASQTSGVPGGNGNYLLDTDNGAVASTSITCTGRVRASKQVAWLSDPQYGSRQATNTVHMLVAERTNDHPTDSTTTTTAKLTAVHVRVPA